MNYYSTIQLDYLDYPVWLHFVLLERYDAAEFLKKCFHAIRSLNSTDFQCTEAEEEISETNIIKLKTVCMAKHNRR